MFQSKKKNHRVALVTRVNSVCEQTRHSIRVVEYASAPRNCWTRYPSIEGFHDAARTYTRTILLHCMGSFLYGAV